MSKQYEKWDKEDWFPHVPVTEVFITGIRRVLERHKAHWLEEKARLDAMVADAVANKTHLPDNYWKPEHAARLSVNITANMLAAFEEGEKGVNGKQEETR